MAERRSIKEIDRRIAFLLARSFRKISQVTTTASSGNLFEFQAEATKNDTFVIFPDYKGSALVFLDGKPLWSLDGYHKSLRIPLGKHKVRMEFSPYMAFGEKTKISPGEPLIVVRDDKTYTLWVYEFMAFELAKQTKDKELSDDLIDVISSSLKPAHFEGVTRDQLFIANSLAPQGKFPKELLEVIPQAGKELEDMGYRMESSSEVRMKDGLQILRAGLQNLRERYGKRGEIAAIAHGHIDTAWLWPFEETERKVARTFSVVLTLLDQHAGRFHYIQSMALYYEWIKKSHPELYARIKKYVGDGTWELGAGWVENDANMISGESFARQLLYSQRFYMDEFGGKKARVYWLPDTFGFAASIPQIAKLSGIELFATHKVFWNDTNIFPYSIFNWVGIDGTSLPSIAFGHGKDGYNSTFAIEEILEQWSGWNSKDSPMLYSFGYGDGGGGPTEEMLERAKVVNELPHLPKTSMLKKSLEQEYRGSFEDRETWRGELYLETHRGVQTSHTKIKYLNRRAEFALRDAELWSALYSSLSRIVDAKQLKEFERLWKVVLKDQFHDVLPGSAIKEVYDTAFRDLEFVIREAETISESSLKEIARFQGPKEGEVLVFNSLPWERSEVVLTRDEIEGSQKVSGGHLALVKAPSIGCAELSSSKEISKGSVGVGESSDHFVIENSFLRISINQSKGTVDSIFDKEALREVLKEKSNEFIFYENAPGWADAWDIEKGYKNTSFRLLKLRECGILEKGPLRATVKLSWETFRHSTVEQEIIAYSNSRRIDFKTTTNLKNRELLLKVWFHFDVNSDKATFDIPFGNYERSTTTNTTWDRARFEVPMQKWADVSENGYGVAMMNDGRYGISCEDSSFGLSVAKTPIYPDYATESEESTFTFSIYPHRAGWREARVPQMACELNSPLRCITTGKVASSKSPAHHFEEGFIRIVDSDNIMLEAIKVPEEGAKGEMVLRLYEMHNRRGEVKIRFWKNVLAARCANLLEEELKTHEEVNISGNEVTVSYLNYEILSLIVRL